MKTILQKLFLSLLLAQISVLVQAYDFTFNGFKYTITNSSKYECEISGPVGSCPAELIIPEYVTNEEDGCVYTVVSVGAGAFHNQDVITSITFPSSLRDIGRKGNSVQGGSFSNCDGLTKIIFPENLETIGFRAFGGCRNLRLVVLNKNLSSVYSTYNWSGVNNCLFLKMVDSFSDTKTSTKWKENLTNVTKIHSS